MGLILSSNNVVDFLKEHNFCPSGFQPTTPVRCQEGTNFNLVVNFGDYLDPETRDSASSTKWNPYPSQYRSLLVKQNRTNGQGGTAGSLAVEWVVQKLVDSYSSLAAIKPLLPEILLLDWSNSILVSVFYDDYLSLDRFYEARGNFDPRIARAFGANLAKIHEATYQQPQQHQFLSHYLRLDDAGEPPNFIKRLTTLDPSVFSRICTDGLNFYKLYQRFPSLEQAVTELYQQSQPVCLIHNDLTIDNLIVDGQIDLDSDSIQIRPEQLKIIDWERINWGEPAVDLGMVVSEYIGGIWLSNLVADGSLDINTMLSLSPVPLSTITPSLKAFLEGYLTQFPEILDRRPNFIRQVVQFAGIGILDRLSYYVEHHYRFHNQSVCKLQVAKNLLCYPEQGIETVFGTTEAELIQYTYSCQVV